MATTITPMKSQMVITGVSELYVSVMTTEDTSATAPSYDTKIHSLPILKEIEIEFNEEAVAFYSSNKVYAGSNLLSGATMTATTFKIDSSIYAELTGQVSGTAGGNSVRAGAINRPYVAVGFAQTGHNGQKVVYWVPKTKWSLSAISGQTQEDTMSEQTSEFEITIYPLSNNDEMIIWADSEDASSSKVNFGSFFEQVVSSVDDIPSSVALSAPTKTK